MTVYGIRRSDTGQWWYTFGGKNTHGWADIPKLYDSLEAAQRGLRGVKTAITRRWQDTEHPRSEVLEIRLISMRVSTKFYQDMDIESEVL